MSTPREPIDNRERILAAAEELFAQQGFAATSVREIVQRAEVTAPVLYYYFGSKDDLLRIMVEQRFAEFLERAKSIQSTHGTLESLIRDWCNSLIEDVVEHPTTLRLILSTLWGPPIPHIQEVVFRSHLAISEVFAASVEHFLGGIDHYRSRFALATLHGSLNTFIFPMLNGCPLDSLAEITEAIVPRVLSILTDEHPIPVQTLHAMENYLSGITSAPPSAR